MTFKTVIVDDEPLARELLAVLLGKHPEIQIVAQCKNGSEAIACLQSQAVDLLFLDVQMPKIGGFDVVERIGVAHLPPTVFVTAYQEHAVRAFDVQAIDYLTKPVEAERLAQALTRVRQRIAAQAAMLTQAQFSEIMRQLGKSYVTRLLVKDGEKEVFLAAEAIEWIEAAEYYCCLHSQGRRYMLRETISDLADRLDPASFVRIHRSSIVHLNQIREIYREGRDEASVQLRNGQRLKMSRAGRQKLLAYGKL